MSNHLGGSGIIRVAAAPIRAGEVVRLDDKQGLVYPMRQRGPLVYLTDVEAVLSSHLDAEVVTLCVDEIVEASERKRGGSSTS